MSAPAPHRRGLRLALALATGLCSLVSHPIAMEAQDPALAIVRAASARYADVTSLCAAFEQRLEVPLLGDERTGSGRLCQARPNLFAMRFSDPAGDAVVVDGASVWYYMPSNDPKQVFRVPVGQGTGGRDFHREFLEDTESKYDVTYEAAVEFGGVPTHRLRLVPRAPASYRAALLWLDASTSVLRQVQLEEENGSRRTISLSDIEFDARVPDGWFDFAPPPGALVISR